MDLEPGAGGGAGMGAAVGGGGAGGGGAGRWVAAGGELLVRNLDDDGGARLARALRDGVEKRVEFGGREAHAAALGFDDDGLFGVIHGKQLSAVSFQLSVKARRCAASGYWG